jgi:hypothetical protein
MTKAILFNAPKSLGKDAAIEHLRSLGCPLVRREAKGKLHTLTQEFFCIQPERYWDIYNDRELKEKPLTEFHIHLDFNSHWRLEQILGYNLIPYGEDNWRGDYLRLVGNKSGSLCEVNLSIREAMIYLSELILKPRFGEDYFGQARVKSIIDGEIMVDSSTGFEEELPPLIDKLEQENILLIRVHREGSTFEGDSRKYIPNGVITNTVDIDSVYGDLEGYLKEVESIVSKFLQVN